MGYLEIDQKRIWFSEQGTGKPLVLLHGFTECSKIWSGFARGLSGQFRVVLIDLPGFGKSDCLAEVHSMELMAGVVKKVLQHLRLRSCVMAGHSMGGYVAMEFARKNHGMLKGLVLFHSHPFSDTPEDRKNRERAIQVIRDDKFNYILQFIPGLFPEESRKKYRKEIDRLLKRAIKIPKETILAAAIGMKERRDSVEVLQYLNIPVLFITGMKDSRIPVHRIGEMVVLPRHSESLILRDIGHMGFIEKPKITMQTLRDFAARCSP